MTDIGATAQILSLEAKDLTSDQKRFPLCNRRMGWGEGLRLEPEGRSVWRPNYNESLKEDLLLCAQQVERAVNPGKFNKTWSLLDGGRAAKEGGNWRDSTFLVLLTG